VYVARSLKVPESQEIFIVSVGVGEKKIVENTLQEDEGMFKGTMFILLILKNNNPDYKMWKSVPKRRSVD
jgi:hypothetical protein